MHRGGGDSDAGFEPGTGPREVGRTVGDGDPAVADGPEVLPLTAVQDGGKFERGTVDRESAGGDEEEFRVGFRDFGPGDAP